MIYLVTEDNKEGKTVCEKIVNKFETDIYLDSLNGIPNLQEYLEGHEKELSNDNQFIIVYDNIMYNPIVASSFNRAKDYIRKYKDKLIFIGIESFEVEYLLIDYIWLLCNLTAYTKYFEKIKEMFDKGISSKEVSYYIRENELYSDWCDKAYTEKRKRRLYSTLSEEELKMSITVETISKYILSRVYTNSGISKPFGNCWNNKCNSCSNKNCITRKKDKHIIDLNIVAEKEESIKDYKYDVVIFNSNYKKVLKKLIELSGEDIKILEESLINIINMDIVESISLYDIINRR